jgi:putative restriction endonuclease
MLIQIAGIDYKRIDTKEKLTVADSFVVRQNKIGGGNGEAKLYVGQESPDLRSFFGQRPFVAECFLKKDDLLKYLDETRQEYENPTQNYHEKNHMPKLWQHRVKTVEFAPEIIAFTVREQAQIGGVRIYVKSDETGFNLIRELALPNITYLSFVKLEDKEMKSSFYVRLFAEFSTPVRRGLELEYNIDNQFITSNAAEEDELTRKALVDARIGQGQYRKDLLKQCPFCPFTLISDDRLLIASHIKPWVDSDNREKIDPNNGFMFTPTYDTLFDSGFISFSDDKKLILSPFISGATADRLGLTDGKSIPHLTTAGRFGYLDYHRKKILKR